MYKAILFDMDGTILDTEHIYFDAFKQKLANKGYELTKNQFMFQMGLSQMDGAKIMTERFFTDLSPEQYLSIVDQEEVRANFVKDDFVIQKMEGFDEILRFFKDKLQYAIATSSPLGTLNSLAKKFNFDKDFSVIVSRDEVLNGKPAPDIYLEAASRLNIDIKDCIVLEDMPVGAMAGKNSGAYTIAVKSEWSKNMEFDTDFECESLLEAMEHIKTLI